MERVVVERKERVAERQVVKHRGDLDRVLLNLYKLGFWAARARFIRERQRSSSFCAGH